MHYHEFRDRSKRKPFQCGLCGRDILDPYHQPKLPLPALESREPGREVVEDEEFYEPPQLTLFGGA